MDPPNSSGAIMGVVDDTVRDGRFLEEVEESPDSDDEADTEEVEEEVVVETRFTTETHIYIYIVCNHIY